MRCAIIGPLQLSEFPRNRVTTDAQNCCYSTTATRNNSHNKQTNPSNYFGRLYFPLFSEMPIAHFTQFHVIRKVSKPARLVAAGCLVFLVYLLYSYHKLPQQEGGEGGSGQVAFKFYSNFEFIVNHNCNARWSSRRRRREIQGFQSYLQNRSKICLDI